MATATSWRAETSTAAIVKTRVLSARPGFRSGWIRARAAIATEGRRKFFDKEVIVGTVTIFIFWFLVNLSERRGAPLSVAVVVIDDDATVVWRCSNERIINLLSRCR